MGLYVPKPTSHIFVSSSALLSRRIGHWVFIYVFQASVMLDSGSVGRSFRGGTMNPFGFSLNRKRFTWPDLRFSGNSAMLGNLRHYQKLIVVHSLLEGAAHEGAQFVERLPP